MIISNTAMAKIYSDAYDAVEFGWSKGQLRDRHGNVCLYGALKQATFQQHTRDLWDTRVAVQLDLADTLVRRSPSARVLSIVARRHVGTSSRIGGHPAGSDGGIMFLEKWNDMKIRRKSQVLAVLAERRDHYQALAKDERIEELEELVRSYSARVAALEAQVRDLKEKIRFLNDEAGFFRKLALGQTRFELVNMTEQALEADELLEDAQVELSQARR